ncbi:uncharacterized protein LOC114955353 [Acropora millepora]|uniref:uncharacterized protein LOC114955353 n=1 Tax=Acropora millepora TaxID=45264 RepID=UPI001CF470E7|nr:uncharacterized protein LOC114955353 [Acropora millepora]
MASAKSKPVPRKDKLCVWTLPEGSQPAIRVQVEAGKICTQDLLEIVGKTLEIHASNLQFFGLFRGIENPTKKYGNNEMIYLPCRSVISFQKWSIDIPREQKYLKTDAGALRLIAIHCVEDIRSGRIKPRPEHLALIEEYRSPDFPCDKQYVELCQKMFGYGYVYLYDCTVKNDLKVKDVRLNEGMKVNLIANRRGLMLKSDTTAFFAPWRKIRRWSQAQGDSVHFEVYFTEELRFDWIEIETEQVAYLMSVIAECIYLMQKDYNEPEPANSSWSGRALKKKLTWKLIKNELFSKKNKDDENDHDDDDDEECQGFDNLEEEASTDGESSDEEEGAKASRRRSRYLFS